MSTQRRELGAWGEQRAAHYLEQQGYVLLERNWRGKQGEIDLIARDGATLVCVEVRTRRSRRFGSAEESITPAKAQRLARLCAEYLQARARRNEPWDGPYRIDIIAINLDSDQSAQINHLAAAIGGEF